MIAIGSCFSGILGLDLAVESVLDARVAWCCESAAFPLRLAPVQSLDVAKSARQCRGAATSRLGVARNTRTNPEPERITAPMAVNRNCFDEILLGIDDGNLAAQLTAEWMRVVKASRDTNKMGSLTLKLTCKPEARRRVVVVSNVTTKLPTPATNPTNFYADDDGNLTSHDPTQQVLKNINITPIKKDDGGK